MNDHTTILCGLTGARRDYINTNHEPSKEVLKQFDKLIQAQLTKISKYNPKA